MSLFVDNINVFLSEKHIRPSYVALITGWNEDKVNRILNGTQDIMSDEAENLALSLGKDMVFFTKEKDDAKREQYKEKYLEMESNHMNQKNRIIAGHLYDMILNYDALVNLSL